MRKELQEYRQNDPATLQALREAAEVAKDAANRWTDNIWSLHGWVSGSLREFSQVRGSVIPGPPRDHASAPDASQCKRQFAGREKELDDFFAENGITDAIDSI